MIEQLKTLILGDRQRISGTVYGTIIAMSVVAAGAKPFEHQLWRLVAVAGVSVVVLWLAHVYSHGLAESLQLGRRITVAELSSIARHESSVVTAAIPLLVAVGLGAGDVLAEGTAVKVALWLGVATLTAQGIRYARLERLSGSATFITVSLNLAIGLGLVALEVLVAH